MLITKTLCEECFSKRNSYPNRVGVCWGSQTLLLWPLSLGKVTKSRFSSFYRSMSNRHWFSALMRNAALPRVSYKVQITHPQGEGGSSKNNPSTTVCMTVYFIKRFPVAWKAWPGLLTALLEVCSNHIGDTTHPPVLLSVAISSGDK